MLVLWPSVGVSAFPFPVQIRSAAPTHEAQRRRELQAAARLEAGGVIRGGRVEVDLEAALQTLVHPVLSCAAFGFVGAAGESKVRVLAGHAGGVGVLAVQQPGPSADVGGDLSLRVVPARELADAVVGALPPAPAGSGAPIRVHTADLTKKTHAQVTVNVSATAAESSIQQLKKLTTGPIVGGGQFTVVRALRGSTRMTSAVSWFDRPEDGRYLMVRGETTRVAPADFATLAAEVGQQLR